MPIRTDLRLCAVLCLGCDAAQQAPATLPTAPAEGWSCPAIESYTPQDLWQYNNGAAEKYIAQDMKQLEVSRCEGPAGLRLVVELYRMGAAEGAQALFEADRPDPARSAGVGTASQLLNQSLSFHSGRCYGRLIAPPDATEAAGALVTLGLAVAALDAPCALR